MQILRSQFARFLLAGGIAATANYGSRFLFSVWASYEAAIVLAYMVGMLVAFILMRGAVFDARHGPRVPQVLKFIGVNALAVAQTLVISVLLARWLLPACGIVTHAEALGHFVGVLVPVMTSYFGHKLLTFR